MLDDGSIDGVLCRWGYMLMANLGAALAETRRVLGDGARAQWVENVEMAWRFESFADYRLPGMCLNVLAT